MEGSVQLICADIVLYLHGDTFFNDFGNNVKKLTRAFEILGASMLVKGVASGNLVEAHIMVKRYWFLDLDFGKGPTQSIITLLNGSSNAQMGLRGATGIFWSGFLTI